MKRSASFRKRILWLGLIPVFCLLAVLAPLWFFMHYRFKESLKYLVARESKGRFTFDAADASISLWKGTITLKDALLYGRDSAAGISCKAGIPEIYFSLGSWKALLLDKKLIVDSVAIIAPVVDLEVRVLRKDRPHSEFHTSDILDALRKALLHLNVHAFSLKDASFTVVEPGISVPLHGEHIDLTVSNFAVINDQDNHFLGSDKVSLSLGPQHWVLSEGGQMIDFSRLRFDSRGQRFELDSFFFRQKIAGSDRVFRLSADRFFFNSRHLPAIYQHAQLLLDTLICVNPVLSIPGDTIAKHGPDAIGDQARAALFKWINIQYVEVIGGRVLVQNKSGHAGNASTQGANLRIYNLRVDPAKPAPLSSDSIRMDLSNIQFVTRDSLYRLSIGAFELHGNDALFREVNYGPTRIGLAKQVVFTAPSLLVKDISIPDLLRKQIHASAAQLVAPQIRMSDNKESDTVDQKRRQVVDAKKIALFYHTLHNIRELIDTRYFDIVDGSVNYTHAGRVPVTAAFTGLSAHILLNKFFISDSLVDIKHAIPDWRISRLELTAPGLHIEVDHYGFNGLVRHSMGQRFHFRTDKGWQLDGEDISWDVLDWDLYQRTKAIQIDSLHLGSLIVHAPKGDSTSPSPAARKPLPAIRIFVLDVDSIAYDQPNSFGALHFAIDRLHVTGIRSSDRSFEWDHAGFAARNLGLDTKQGRVDMRQLRFDSESGVTAEDVRIALSGKGIGGKGPSDKGPSDKGPSDKGPSENVPSGKGPSDKVFGGTVQAPLVTIAASWHSTDLRLLTVNAVVVPNAGFVLDGNIGKDRLNTQGVLTIKLHPRQLLPSFSAALDLSFRETNLAIRSDSMTLQAKGVSGAFHDELFALPGSSPTPGGAAPIVPPDAAPAGAPGAAPTDARSAAPIGPRGAMALTPATATRPPASPPATNVRSWLDRITIHTADIAVVTKKISAHAGDCSWDPAASRLRLTDLSILPVDTRDETFRRSRWQMDYITLKGRALTITDLQLASGPKQLSVGVGKVTLDGVSVEASRDKHMPFRHGIEKPMPTKLIGIIPFALRVDTTALVDCNVTYHELSLATNRWSSIPIGNINGYVFDIASRAGAPGRAGTLGGAAAAGPRAGVGGARASVAGHGTGVAGTGIGVAGAGTGVAGAGIGVADTLVVEVRGRLFDGEIRRFYYAESYGDSLSGFTARSSFSRLDLTRFSQALIPAAAVSITDGHVDTAWSSWKGNKYATYGILDLDYAKLRIKVLNKKDSVHRGIVPTFETWAARLLLRNKNTKTSLIYFERDREKFVFNYWVKAQGSGVLSTLLRIKNEQYRKAFEQKCREYKLPDDGLRGVHQ